jgi:hypothetical protein
MPLKFFKSLFKRFKPMVVRDDYLGEISNDRYGNWNGSKQFAPTNSKIDFSFRTGDEPPSQKQIAFFREVESRFSDLWAELRSTLFEDLDDLADGTTMEQLFDSLSVNYISFWDVTNEPYKWEISCTTDLDDHIFGIQMAGFENQGFRMDG